MEKIHRVCLEHYKFDCSICYPNHWTNKNSEEKGKDGGGGGDTIQNQKKDDKNTLSSVTSSQKPVQTSQSSGNNTNGNGIPAPAPPTVPAVKVRKPLAPAPISVKKASSVSRPSTAGSVVPNYSLFPNPYTPAAPYGGGPSTGNFPVSFQTPNVPVANRITATPLGLTASLGATSGLPTNSASNYANYATNYAANYANNATNYASNYANYATNYANYYNNAANSAVNYSNYALNNNGYAAPTNNPVNNTPFYSATYSTAAANQITAAAPSFVPPTTSSGLYAPPTNAALPTTNTNTSTKAPKRKKSVTLIPPKLKKIPKETLIDDPIALQIFQDLKVKPQFLTSGKVLAWAVQPDDPAFINIHDYIARSQEHGFGVKVQSIIRIIVKADELDNQSALDFNEDPMAADMYRMMLWHGTKANSVTSIMENGLKLPTMHGQMFGAGIYFADRVSKSCQYCDRYGNGYSPGKVAYLFLCDVLLGEMYKSNTALPNYTSAPTTYGWGQGPVEFNSVKGCGLNVPDVEWQKEIEGCMWPLGPTVPNTEDQGPLSLNYNEYIVYNTNQVQPKYLVKVEFTSTPVYENIY